MTNGSESVLSVRGCLKVIGVLVLLTIVVMVALFVLARSTADWVIEGIGQGLADLGETVASIPESVANAVSDAFRNEMQASIETKVMLAESINSMGTLLTASHFGDADVKVGVRSGLFNVCGVSVDHVVEGTIEAGIELAQISSVDITHEIIPDSWVLRVGPAKLHSCRIDYIRQLGHSLTVCRQDWDEYRLLAESDSITKIRDEALAEELLSKAEREAGLVLTNFLSAVTGTDNITIAFESEPDPDLPPSCQREPPTGWKFDEESDSWVRE